MVSVLALTDKNIESPGIKVMGRGCTTPKVGINGVRVIVGVVSCVGDSISVGVNVNVGSGCVEVTVGVSLKTGVSVGNAFTVGVGETNKAIISGIEEHPTKKKDIMTTKSVLTNGIFICLEVQKCNIIANYTRRTHTIHNRSKTIRYSKTFFEILRI